jgi:pyruvate dehydrogenase E2 component (dihydrolipoamide acetyltransferase)
VVGKQVAVVMPKMSMTMTEGTLVAWHKAEGDAVRQGEVVCEVTTDKVDMEVEATVDGTLSRLVAQPEDVVAVGEPIAYVTSEADDLLDGLFDDPAAADEPGPRADPEGTGAPAANDGAGERAPAEPGTELIAAVPAARQRAEEHGIDLATVTATGPWHTIRLSDVDALLTRNGNGNGERAAGPRGTGRARGGRAVIAKRMAASAGVPQFVLYRDLDLQAAQEARGAHGWTPVFVQVLARALRRHPELNASWVDGELVCHEHTGVALAVDTDRGLLAPVLADADRCALDVLSARIDDVVRRARTGRLQLTELAAPATTTVSNLGGFGVEAFQALLTPPQATALSLGAVESKVVPVPGGIGTRLRCSAGLSVDHRVADGAAGARPWLFTAASATAR